LFAYLKDFISFLMDQTLVILQQETPKYLLVITQTIPEDIRTIMFQSHVTSLDDLHRWDQWCETQEWLYRPLQTQLQIDTIVFINTLWPSEDISEDAPPSEDTKK